MNILVYSGPEVLQTSLSYTLSSLRSLVLPHYTVQTVSAQALAAHPWTTACALLVFPSCHELSSTKSIAAVRSYVESGGSFLGFGAGVRCSSRALDFGVLAIGQSAKDQVLRFYDKGSGTYVYPQFRAGGASAPRSTSIQTENGQKLEDIFDDSPRGALDVEGARNAQILAEYVADDGKTSAAAAVRCDIGNGKVILWAPSLDYPITEETLSLTQTSTPLSADGIRRAEERRQAVLKGTLQELRLKLPDSGDINVISRPLPQFLIGHPAKLGIVPYILKELSLSLSPPHESHAFEDENDTFHFHALTDSTTVLQASRTRFENETDPSAWQPKQVIACSDGELPPSEQTPLFDIALFFEALSAARSDAGCKTDVNPWGVGEALLYGQVVTSTQTMLDKNPRLLSLLPTPLVSLASQQLAGRGRGANIWLSPAGCLQFSLLLRAPLSALPASKLVFVQYLFSLAVVEACRTDGVLGKLGTQVRLKWPNDLYAVVGPGEGDKLKLGGILVNTSFSGGKVEIVIGSGLNVLNPPPIMSLSQLAPDRTLSMERTAAAILAKFEAMWATFLAHRGSFEPFVGLYLERWLHSDQVVTLTTTVPHKKVRITGITSDHGLLRTVPERTGWYSGDEGFIDLQPDGNSFDIMAGLIKTKTV